MAHSNIFRGSELRAGNQTDGSEGTHSRSPRCTGIEESDARAGSSLRADGDAHAAQVTLDSP